MFLKRTKRVWKTIGFRLTLWHSIIFSFSSVILFGFAYLLILYSLTKHDRELINLKLQELSGEYEAGNVQELQREVTIERKYLGKDQFFIRVAGPHNKTILSNIYNQWPDFNIKKFERISPNEHGKWMRIKATHSNDALEVASVRLADGNWLQVGRGNRESNQLLQRFLRIFAIILAPLLVLGFVSGSFLAFRALRPIRHLIKVVRSIEGGTLGARVPSPRTGDELDQLVTLFNGMLERIQVLITDMKAALDNVAHDLRTPITRLRGSAEIALQSGKTTDSYREALTDCMEESEEILMMLNTLMDISEAETGVIKLDLKTVNMSDLLEDVIELYRFLAEEKEIVLKSTVHKDLLLTADPSRIKQILANILDNAIKYTPRSGQVELQAYPGNQAVVIKIRDTGIGIPQRELPKIWDRLYRCDQSRSKKGLGLGLSLVRAIVQAHKGKVEVTSEPGEGSTFTVYLPTGN